MSKEGSISVAISLIGILAVFTALNKLVLPSHSYVWREIHNFGHTPLFGLLSLAILNLSIRLLGSVFPRHRVHYIIAFGLTFLLGLITELAQIIGPRDADPLDQVRNTVGALIALGWYATIDPHLRTGFARHHRSLRILFRTAVILLCLVSIAPTILWIEAYRYRNDQFPALCRFESWREHWFIRPHDASVSIVPTPSAWSDNHSGSVGSITFDTTVEYPGFVFDDPPADWSDYRALTLTAFSSEDTTVMLYLTIEDHTHNHEYDDRYNRRFTIIPGANTVSVPLDSVRNAPSSRVMDLTRIENLNIFMVGPRRPTTLYLDDITLE